MSVKFLPKEIRSRIRSGITINTLVDCVEALVQNAIDADANCVAVRIDLPFYKIQVVDNGRGINKHDFALVGERYATSKCHCLGDLGNAKYYGYRGEALASLCEISQELTVVSRAEQEDKTYAKTFRGAGRRIDGAALRRPSCGTTITVSGFLYNLPVRQAAIGGAMELEWVRRSLECLAISNPSVSFSLRDDSSNAWCFRVPKSDSVVTTFSHIFGSVWASALKAVSGSTPPFSVSGLFSFKGHRNKNYQFLYVHRRRIANHRLGEIINQLFGSFFGCNACGTSSFPRRASDANEKYPVFVLKVECPTEFYDVGFHPSKTVVEFKKSDVLFDLVKSTLVAFLSKRIETPASPKVQQGDGQNSTGLRQEDTVKITAQNYKHSLHSLAAKRAHQPEVEDVACKRFSETSTSMDLNKAQMDRFCTPETPEANLKSLNSLIEDSAMLRVERLPAEGFGPFSNPSPDLQRPIHLSPALDHKRAALGKFIDVKKRQERIGKAIADLKRFSHKIQQLESSQHTSVLDLVANHEISYTQETSRGQKTTDLQNLPVNNEELAEDECRNQYHPKSNRRGTSNADLTAANQLPKPKTDVLVVSLAGSVIQASTHFSTTNECRSNQSITRKRSETQKSDSIFSKQGMLSHTLLQLPPFSTCLKRYRGQQSPAVINQPTAEQSLADFQRSDSHVLSSMDLRVSNSHRSQEIEKSKTASLGNIHVDVENTQQQILVLPPASDAQPQSISKSRFLESPYLPNECLTPDLKIPSSNGGQKEAPGQKQWFLGTEPKGKRDIYINSESGHSYYGRPPASLTLSLTTTLVVGHPLPLDTSISDTQLATDSLPLRPWRSRISDSDVAGNHGKYTSKGREEQSVKRMLQMWENPVFKVDPLLTPSLFGLPADTGNMSTLGIKPYVFHKDIFESGMVIAQVDQKFIVCSVHQDITNGKAPFQRRLLVAFDQHAVHERIRLEDLIRDAENHDGSDRLKTTQLDPPLTFHLPSHVARVCLSHQVELISKGIEISACNNVDNDHTLVCISQIPSCLVETGKARTDQPTVEASIIENLLCELVEALENTGTFGTDMPNVILDVLKSQACHGAIKFGDPLSVAACQNMIKTLGQCKLPFFCAHGRPSIVPLFDYNLLGNEDAEVSKPNLQKLASR